MAYSNSSHKRLYESDMSSDLDTNWTESSENSTVNGLDNNHHLHPNSTQIHSNEYLYPEDYEEYSYSENSSIHYDENSYSENYYTDLMYQLHDFEEKIYVYVWTFLVILTAFCNVLIVAVFVRKNMRTTTNLILLFIAISDSLTGLVTLPTFIHVFTSGKLGWVSLTEGWCEAFMISKFYISKAFHTVSIWLTLLLGFQRFVCVWFPFKTRSWFTTRRTMIAIMVITICAFVIHSYHIIKKKADKIQGWCQWEIEHPCVETCAFLWTILLLVNILPSLLLLVFTILMIQKLLHHNMRKESFSAEQKRERDQQNRRASIIVVCIVIIFLVPEVPFGIYLLVTVIKKHKGQEILELRDNRLFHVVYEIALLISFHANFWVYIIMNRRFRDELKFMFLNCIKNMRPERTVPSTTVVLESNQSQSNSTKGTDMNEESSFV